ncbi:MAG: hypothetical protein H0V70_10080 [Ktedonobacteraceae bacterium]|nr:hypothetical protein [Ktedonobacteraceae bacterium]
MLHDSQEQQHILERTLSELAFREQSRLLFQAAQHLPYKEKAMILGAGGKHLLRKRFLPLVLHLLYTHFIKGAIWSVITLLLAIFCLILLLYLGQTNPGEITPVFLTTVAYFAGFFLATLLRIGKDIHQLIRKTVSQQEYQRILRQVQGLDQVQKVAVLRTLSMALSQSDTGGSFVSPFLTEIALLLGTVFMAGVIILLSLFHVPDGLPALILVFGVVALGFCAGFYVRRILYAGVASLSARRHRKRSD